MRNVIKTFNTVRKVLLSNTQTFFLSQRYQVRVVGAEGAARRENRLKLYLPRRSTGSPLGAKALTCVPKLALD
jgi:hypothetical protein